MTEFKDHYSQFSQTYARGRLQYPPELFLYLASLTQGHELAWDCGTGNGQAAVGLTDHYQKIIATDPSRQQIENCRPHPQITYLVEPAEDPSLKNASADLLTVGIALHWFNFESFYPQAHRVLKKGGIFAAWAYFLPVISPQIDVVLKKFETEILGKYWKPEIKLIHEEYKTIPFPFEEIVAPDLFIRKKLNLSGFIDHVHTWSAVQFYKKEQNEDPVSIITEELSALWGSPDTEREIQWKMPLRVGRNL